MAYTQFQACAVVHRWIYWCQRWHFWYAKDVQLDLLPTSHADVLFATQGWHDAEYSIGNLLYAAGHPDSLFGLLDEMPASPAEVAGPGMVALPVWLVVWFA